MSKAESTATACMVKIKKSSYGAEVGAKFGSWEVIGPPFSIGRNKWRVVAKCECGTVAAVQTDHLGSGHSNNCPSCATRFTAIHGGTGTRLHRIWTAIKNRCRNQNFVRYANYGGRGIGICEAWSDYAVFRDWALVNGYADELEIDRIDNDGNYEPGNCRWVTTKSNNRNKRTNRVANAFGESKCVKEWSEDSRCNVPYFVLVQRLKTGWDAELAITTKAAKRLTRRQPPG